MDRANAVLDRFLEPVGLSLDQAKILADFRADAVTQLRTDELARKCNEGSMTPQERSEYEDLVEAGDFIAILQAKAREILARAKL